MKVKKLLLILFLILSVVGSALWLRPDAPAPQGKLMAFGEGGKIGFKDEAGNIVLAPRFEDYRTKEGASYERFDPVKGPPDSEEYLRSLEIFPDGLCLVKQLGKWGYVDSRGKLQIKPIYEKAQPFHKGQALVSRFGVWKVIDRNGKTVRETGYEDVSEIWSEGFTTYQKSGRAGFLDADLKEISEVAFPEVFPFSQGLARVGGGKLWGFLGQDGKMVVERVYMGLRDFSEGLAAAATETNLSGSASKWGFLDPKGKWIIAPKYDQALDFSQGLAAVLTGADRYGLGGDWGFIDKRGKFAIKPSFKRVSRFTEGVAAFTRNPDLDFRGALWGLVDQKGRVLVEPKFGPMADLAFKEGKALVKLQEQYVWIDPKGDIVEAPR